MGKPVEVSPRARRIRSCCGNHASRLDGLAKSNSRTIILVPRPDAVGTEPERKDLPGSATHPRRRVPLGRINRRLPSHNAFTEPNVPAAALSARIQGTC